MEHQPLCDHCQPEYLRRMNRADALMMRAKELSDFGLATQSDSEFMCAKVYQEICYRDHLSLPDWKCVGGLL